MADGAISHNPYEAPQSTDPADSKSEGFRWRLIPVVLIAGFGTMCLLGGVLATGTMIFMYHAAPESSVETEVMSGEIAECVLATLMGAWFLFAARIGWKGRWKTAIAMSLGLYLVGVVVSFYFAA